MTDFWEPADVRFVLIGGNGDPNVIQTGDHDIASIQTAHQLIDMQLRKSGSGYLSYARPGEACAHIRQEAGMGSHQLGTTRMSTDPSAGGG